MALQSGPTGSRLSKFLHETKLLNTKKALRRCVIRTSSPLAETCGNLLQMLVQRVPVKMASAWATPPLAGARRQQHRLSILQKTF